jgi:hypothetical protein
MSGFDLVSLFTGGMFLGAFLTVLVLGFLMWGFFKDFWNHL